MDDDLGPGLLLSHGSDLLVKFLNLPFDCGEVWGKFLFSESIDRGEGEVSPVVPLDSRDCDLGWCFLMAGDIVDGISHL